MYVQILYRFQMYQCKNFKSHGIMIKYNNPIQNLFFVSLLSKHSNLLFISNVTFHNAFTLKCW